MTESITDVLGETAGQVDIDPFAGSLPAVAASYSGFAFTCQRFVLHDLLNKVAPVIPAREGYQTVLNNFHIQAAPGMLRVTGTDMELRIVASTPAVMVTSACKYGHEYESDCAPHCAEVPPVVLAAKRLLAIIKEAPDGEVTVAVKGDMATVTAGTASWELKLSSDGRDYPAPPDLDAVEWKETARMPLLGALRSVRYAVSRNGTNASLAQVDIRVRESDGRPCLTACDRTRFAQVPLPGFPLQMRIPAAGSPSAVDELVRLLSGSESGSVRVGISGGRLFFAVDSTVFVVSQLPDEFPDVWHLLLEPAMANDEKLTVKRDDLRGAIRRVRINADDATSAIGLTLAEGRLTVFARDKSHNQAEAAVEAIWEHPERTLVVNHQFLDQMLSVHPSGECVLRLGRSVGKRGSAVLLLDEGSGATGIINQMSGSLLGY
jgi:DNA polymerase III subunit beta